LIEEKKVDLVAVGRSLLADPYLPKKYYENRAREIRPCIACNDCVGMMFQGWQIHCTVNPELGNEYLDSIKPARTPKKVLIIGGGPAGMQCALVSAQRGHNVTLIEKTGQLGGMLQVASTPAYKGQEIEAVIEYFKYMLNKVNVKVMLNTEIGDKFPDELKADIAVIATGAFSRPVQFKGSEFVLDAVEALQSKGKGVGKDVVIIGASGVGIDVALYLKEKQGKKVRVVEKLGEIGGDVNVLLRSNILKWAEEQGVEFYTDHEVLRVEKGKVFVKTLLGDNVLDCDTVISATGFSPNPSDHLKRFLEEKGMEVVVTGNANEPGKLFDATQGGFWIGTEL
jgi:NADPH-dependent 2,4-dienoyl-CoA reductase/sulfur reductase-like enzyme